MSETHYVLERFYQVYAAKLKTEDKKLLEIYATRRKSQVVWWKRICFKEMLRPSVGGRVALRVCFLLARY